MQYFGNGYWKAQVFRKRRDYLISPSLSGGIVVGTVVIVALFAPLLLLGLVYLGLATWTISCVSGRVNSAAFRHIPGAVVAVFLMHISYVCGFLWGLLSTPAE